jgi:hypothetical protein
MLDIGALDTEVPKFWLKDHLASYLPQATPAPSQPKNKEEDVLPPEHYFGQ